jgi:TonB family protein
MKKVTHIIFLGIVLLIGGLPASGQRERSIVRREYLDCPNIAAKMSLRGTVRLKIWIAPDGTVRREQYIDGHLLLAESALKAVRNWKYAPAVKESTQTVEVKF